MQKIKEVGKVKYTVENLLLGVVQFVNKVLKNFEGKMAYQGYTVSIK